MEQLSVSSGREVVKKYVVGSVYERAKIWVYQHKLGLFLVMTGIPLITTGTFCYVMYRKMKSYLNFGDFDPEKQDLIMNIQSYFDNSQQTCRNTLYCVVGGTNQKIKKYTEFPSREQLHVRDPAVWKRLLVKVFTRLLSSCYTTSLLSCFLQVQMVLIIRYKFLTFYIQKQYSNPNSNELELSLSDITIKEDIQEQFLSHTNFFLEQGIQGLIEFKIEPVVQQYCEGIVLNSFVEAQDVLEMIKQIRSNIERNIRFEQFLLPGEGDGFGVVEGSSEQGEDQAKLHLLLSETRNYIETERFVEAVKACVDINVNHSSRLWLEGIFGEKTPKLPWARVASLSLAADADRSNTTEGVNIDGMLNNELVRNFAFDIFSDFDGLVEI